ncbi:MAG: PQQ-binding-like beta-propeller repeat protein [Opitutales bacterium]
MLKKTFISLTILLTACALSAGNVLEFRGEARQGIYDETGLLKTWGEGQPKLLWQLDDIGEGYLPPSVVDGKLYLCVLDEAKKEEVLKVLDKDGKLLWELVYGKAWTKSYNSTRVMPTIVGDFAYMASGAGEVVCVDLKSKKIAWSVNAAKEYEGKTLPWGYGENILVAENKVIFTAGGTKSTVVALDAKTGKLIWKSGVVGDKASYTSPVLMEYKGKKSIFTTVDTYALGVDFENGEILWSYNLKPEGFVKTKKDNLKWKVMGASPIYRDGKVLCTSGYESGAYLFEIPEGKGEVKVAWENSELDHHHGGLVLLGDRLYGANWKSNTSGSWQCVDWKSGKTIYNQEWEGFSKGSMVYADGLLYVYEEKRGEVAIVDPKADKFEPISSFTITDGKGPHWAHIVIADKVMYIKHGEVLFAYDIKE